MAIEIVIFSIVACFICYVIIKLTCYYDTKQHYEFQRRERIVVAEHYSYLEHRDQFETQQHSNRVRNDSNTVSSPRRQFNRVRNYSNELSPPRRQFDSVSILRQRIDSVLFPQGNSVSFLNLPLETNIAQSVMSFFSRFSGNNKIRLVVRSITQVRNPHLLAMYKLRKAEMLSRYGCVEEKLLFHGTHQKNVRSICDDNFNWRFFGKSVGNRYGQGVSFTPEAMYASHYCDKNPSLKTMFLVRVLYSKSIIGTEDMVIPFVKQGERIIIYDASRKENGRVIVKYCDNEFYPAFIIYFESIVVEQSVKK